MFQWERRGLEDEDVDWIQLAQDRVAAGSFKHRNESSGPVKGVEFLGLPSSCQVLKKRSAP
jgi:hypothetical protein